MEPLIPASPDSGFARYLLREVRGTGTHLVTGAVMSGFNTKTPRRILVTGAAGFLGSHLCDRLLASDPDVEIVAVDSLFSGSRSNIEHLRSHPRFEFLRHDVTVPLF